MKERWNARKPQWMRLLPAATVPAAVLLLAGSTALAGPKQAGPGAGMKPGMQPPAGGMTAVGFPGVGFPKPQVPLTKATYLGVGVDRVQPVVRSQFGLPEGTGLVVTYVDPDGPSAGKLRRFDVLTRLDDQILVNPEQLAVLVRLHKPGDKVSLTLIRNGKTTTVEVALGEKELPPVEALFQQPPAVPFPVPIPGMPAPNVMSPQGISPMPQPLHPSFPENGKGPGPKQHAPGRPLPRAPERAGMPPFAPGPQPPGVRPGGFGTATAVAGGAGAISTISSNGRTVTVTTVPGEGTRVVCLENGRVVFRGNLDDPEDRKRIPPEFQPLLEKIQIKVQTNIGNAPPPAPPGPPPAF